MILSMTGYGRAVKTYENREITVEIRSVNNRYFDCSVKLPRAYSFLEDEVKKLLKEKITRGKIDVFVTVRVMEGNDTKVALNRSVVESYLSALHTITEEYGIKDDITVSSLMNLPDVFIIEHDEIDEEESRREILETAAEAVNQHTAMRAVEGEAMAQDLRGRSNTILAIVGEIEKRSAVTVAEYRQRLYEKLKEVLNTTAIDESRILTEAAIFADKIAVDEETVRLRSHFAQLDQMLKDGGPIGRKLDFLVQEMNREANTTGSKGNDIEQARHVVEIKAELEKIREQVQNIE